MKIMLKKDMDFSNNSHYRKNKYLNSNINVYFLTKYMHFDNSNQMSILK